MKERLKNEFWEIGLEVLGKGLKVGVNDIQEIKKRNEQMYVGFVLV